MKNINAKLLIPRMAVESDFEKILDLYKKVSENAGGIARTSNEISIEYMQDCMKKSANNGIQLVIENPLDKNMLLAEMHCYKLVHKVFDHVLSELTIVVNPSYQCLGIGKQLFTTLLTKIQNERNDILRVELIARESNIHALQFYKKIGFNVEGKFEKRIMSEDGDVEADIPMAWFNKNYNNKKTKS